MKNKIHAFVVLAYKESPYLEACVKSVICQRQYSEVVIATSTPNAFISSIADKYGIKVVINPNPGKGIGFDFDFARTCTSCDLITIAHQDDIYESTYAEKIISAYRVYPDATMLFTFYYEIRGDKKIYSNTNLKIKELLLSLVKHKKIATYTWIKRSAIRFGNAICCPAVTYVNSNIKVSRVFDTEFKCNVDWYAWEKISKMRGRFVFLDEALMGHRVHEESTTTEIIHDRIRTKEDYQMFTKFWPKCVAYGLNKFYVKAEKSNEKEF